MSDLGIKRTVTQGELDAAYASLPQLDPVVPAVAEVVPVAEPAAGAKLPSSHSVGVHIQKDRTIVVWLGADREILRHVALNQGYEKAEALVNELGEALASVRGKKVPVYVSLTGAPSPTVFADFPRMNRANLMKALRMQFRTQFGEEPEEIQLQALGNNKTEKHTCYFALGVKKTLLETILRPLRKQKIRVTAWDADLFAYVRAAGALWERNGGGQGTRFLIVLEWDHCFLLVADSEKRLLALRLGVGVQSFLQHLVSTREAHPNPDTASGASAGDAVPLQKRERQLHTNQAIHDVYIPFAQQIRTQLFSACNEQGITLPTHFALVAAGANLFQMMESLAYDLSLSPVRLGAELPSEAVGAYGTALYDDSGLVVNALPRGKGEWVRSAREAVRAALSRLSPAQGLSDAIPMNIGVLLGIPALILVALAAVPFYQRWKVSARLEHAKREQASLEADKKQIQQGKDRESLYDRKMQLIGQIELKQWRISSALKELFSTIPPAIRLQSLTFKDGIFTLKGLTKEPVAVESFLKAAIDLRLLVEPTPVDVHRDKKQTTFEITFRYKG